MCCCCHFTAILDLLFTVCCSTVSIFTAAERGIWYLASRSLSLATQMKYLAVDKATARWRRAPACVFKRTNEKRPTCIKERRKRNKERGSRVDIKQGGHKMSVIFFTIPFLRCNACVNCQVLLVGIRIFLLRHPVLNRPITGMHLFPFLTRAPNFLVRSRMLKLTSLEATGKIYLTIAG